METTRASEILRALADVGDPYPEFVASIVSVFDGQSPPPFMATLQCLVA